MGIASHYEVLGVTADASPAAVRDAYRRLARTHHPDRAGRAVRMAEINDAYRVLRDPRARSAYDASLAALRSSAVPPSTPGVRPTITMDGPAHRPDPGPARFPWRLSAAMAGVGCAVVLVGAALYERPGEPVPDNVLREGSCVAIEINSDAREVNCTGGADDLVVTALVATGEICPSGTAAHRDRQGMGVACVVGRGT